MVMSISSLKSVDN